MTTIRSAAENAAAAAIAARTEELFRRSGALKEGHFLLKSGKHSERYLEKFLVLQDPAATSELCGFWAARYRGEDGTPTVDLVAGPTTGGVVLAFETGRQLGVRAIFAEEVRSADGSARREFRRGFTIAAGERVLLVEQDDALRLTMADMLNAAGYEVVAADTALTGPEVLETGDTTFDLLLTSVTLPDRDGLWLADRCLAQCPGLAVLLSSAYADNRSRWMEVGQRGLLFLPQPFSLPELLSAVRSALAKSQT